MFKKKRINTKEKNKGNRDLADLPTSKKYKNIFKLVKQLATFLRQSHVCVARLCRPSSEYHKS